MKKALGRGVEALFGPTKKRVKESDPLSNEIHKKEEPKDSIKRIDSVNLIPLGNIIANPDQPRKIFDEYELKSLSQSIQENGLIQPLTIFRSEQKGKYVLISGERRLRASKIANLKEVPCYIREPLDSPHSSLLLALVENIQRDNLSPLEEAEAFYNLKNQFNLDYSKISSKVGKNRTTIVNFIRLLSLPSEAKDALKNKKISAGHARAILSHDLLESQLELLNFILKNNWTVRQAEKWKGKGGTKGRKIKKKTVSTSSKIAIKELENKLRHIFATKVSIGLEKDGKGKIQIEFYNKEDLDRILDNLMK